MTDYTAFWIDQEYDRDFASQRGGSRYHAYLRDRAHSIAKMFDEHTRMYDDDTPPTVPFALRAWEIANGPIMSPGLVRRHPRVDGVTLSRSEWDGEVIANVSLVVPAPAVLRNATDPNGRWYKDRRRDSWGSRHFEGVSGQDLAEPGGYLVTTSEVIWQLAAGNLPEVVWKPNDDPRILLHDKPEDFVMQLVHDLFPTAEECVAELVRQLSRQITPLIEQLEKT